MSKSDLPDYKLKKKLLFKPDAAPAVLIQQGEAFFEAGWLKDAIDFFERAEHSEGLQRIREQAREEGDAFLLGLCLRAQKEEAPATEWSGLADRALVLGKLQFAQEAYRQAGDHKGLEKVHKLIEPTKVEPEAVPEQEQA